MKEKNALSPKPQATSLKYERKILVLDIRNKYRKEQIIKSITLVLFGVLVLLWL
jgi:hypothetical protein